MQLIQNGPDIPERLLQAHEEGRVVFFCGAGISGPARLPGFRDLVERVYEELGVDWWAPETAAFKKGLYDTVLGLLESRIVGGRHEVRRKVARVVTPDLTLPDATTTHEALLTLSCDRKGRHRLITTNFDRLFEEAKQRLDKSIQRFEAPYVPVPKCRWDGLVYLHGLLSNQPSETQFDRLVLSSGDFGIAYLTERWAARFISELFRAFTVCFVGYSINDPVLRYMMDALAADRLLGEAPPEVFAFGSYSRGNEADAANEWKAKNVTAILYQDDDHHHYLHRTLRAWAATYRDGVLGKEALITRYSLTRPTGSTEQDDYVGRMLWALSDESGLPAKRFAEFEPLPSLDWLEAMSQTRFRQADLGRFGVQPNAQTDRKLAFSLIARPTPYTLAPWMMLVHRGGDGDRRWDAVMQWIAHWLSRHLDDPKLLLWVAGHGGRLHHTFAWLVTKRIIEAPPSASMQILWRVVLAGRLRELTASRDLYSWRSRFNIEGLTTTLRLELRELLTPKVRLSQPLRWRHEGDPRHEDATLRIRDLVDWEVVLASDGGRLVLGQLRANALWHAALPDLLSDATELLRDALDLMRELEGADDRRDGSYVAHPSISEHPQNRHLRDWTVLIDLVRDAWLATAEGSPARASLEAERWLSIPYPLFRRLVFFTGTHAQLIEPRLSLQRLLADGHWWLWSVETEREAMRLLVALSGQLNVEDGRTLQQAILAGPPVGMFKDDADPERLRRIIDREVWTRLAKCRAGGALLEPDATARLDVLGKQYPAWRMDENEREEFPFWMGNGEDLREFKATPLQRRELEAWLRENPTGDDWHRDNWADRCKTDFSRTAAALMGLARQGEWYMYRWREALQAWSDDALLHPSWRHMANVLVGAPDNKLKELSQSVSWWLQALAKTFQGQDEAFLALIRRVLELHRGEAIQPHDDIVFRAINHPVGQVVEAALIWWSRQGLRDGQRLPNEIAGIFTDICDPDVTSFRYGRVLLASRVITLFRVDPSWTENWLLHFFDWDRSREEARGVWNGFLWSPRLYEPLLTRIKVEFLATARHYEDLGDHGEQYAGLLTFAALEGGDLFSRQELVAATSLLPPSGRQRAILTLVDVLISAGDQSADYWHNRVLPYVRRIWPKEREGNNPTISEFFARLCIAAGDAFPEALDELKNWLSLSEHPSLIVHQLHHSGLCQRFPIPALTLLDAVIDDAVQWPPEDLEKCLNAIREAQPPLEDDRSFRRLLLVLRKHGLG